MVMRTIPCSLLFVLAACAVASAQPTPDLQIRLGAYVVTPLGGEHPGGVWFSTGPVAIGKTSTSTYSFGDSCEAWGVSSDGSVREDATTAWRIEITPIRVVGHAVRFRLRWVRVMGLAQQLEHISLDAPTAAKLPGEDIELNLGPGESWPVDIVRVPPRTWMVDGRPCGSTASIRVSVDRYPGAEQDHRLIGAELWLVERLADGSEAQLSQPLALRGLPGRPFNFYFDSIVDGAATLDVYGVLMARKLGEPVFVSVETRSRWAPEPRNISGPQRSVNSEIQVRPEETVEIRLPLLGEAAGPFAKRALSIRIRARQIR
jgi:hypothetical protein